MQGQNSVRLGNEVIGLERRIRSVEREIIGDDV